jgi:hypothetical protein
VIFAFWVSCLGFILCSGDVIALFIPAKPRNCVTPAKPSTLVIPAKAGIQFLAFLFGFRIFTAFATTDSRPCVVPSGILPAGSLLLLAQEK